MEEKAMVVITLESFPPYENFIETLNTTSNHKYLTFEQLSGKLLQEDRQKQQFGNNNINESFKVALVAKFKSKGNKHIKENDGHSSEWTASMLLVQSFFLFVF
jgi:hypothetical protein